LTYFESLKYFEYLFLASRGASANAVSDRSMQQKGILHLGSMQRRARSSARSRARSSARSARLFVLAICQPNTQKKNGKINK
jgi:hypothetical protein